MHEPDVSLIHPLPSVLSLLELSQGVAISCVENMGFEAK